MSEMFKENTNNVIAEKKSEEDAFVKLSTEDNNGNRKLDEKIEVNFTNEKNVNRYYCGKFRTGS